MFVVPITATIGEARAALREHIHEPDFALFVYIVDSLETQQLRGVLSLRDLVAASDDQPLAACVRSNVLALQPLEPAKTAAYRVIDSHLAALLVLGNNRRLLGILTVDAAISEVLSPQMRAQLPRIFS